MKVVNAKTQTIADDARMRLVEVGGRTSEDLGLGRIVGEILVDLYLREGARSLDQISADLGLSKAAVSVAVRQLEALGLLKRVWRRGDRKKYYRTADNIAAALQQGLLTFIRQKMQLAGMELDDVHAALDAASGEKQEDAELRFLRQRVKRAKQLRDRAARMVENPLLKLFAKL